MNLLPDLAAENRRFLTRRWFFRDCGVKLGTIALASLLRDYLDPAARAAIQATNLMAPRQPHFPAKAKRVIYLFQAGAPSHLELFDYKPQLAKFDGKLPPTELLKGYRAAFINPNSTLLGPKYKFNKVGKSGTELSELLPGLAEVVDDIAIVKSMKTDAFNHAPAQIFMNTGAQQFGRPSMGSWVTYGLGSESQDLPGYVVFSTGRRARAAGRAIGAPAFCRRLIKACSSAARAIRSCISRIRQAWTTRCNATHSTRSVRLNEQRLGVTGDPEIATRINSFELAYRMQGVAPEVMDLTRESKETLEMYGAKPGENSYANACLLSRRLIEKGVRFVQIFHEAWDHHGGLTSGLKEQCGKTDRASAALVKDLKQRGLLDDTLVIWGGEFGRTPMVQGGNDGRDHHPNCFTMWLAGGGVKRGLVLGGSDEFGFNATEDVVHVHDLHATILHLLGFDHTKLIHRFQGRDFRLTDVHGEIVHKLLA